MCYSVKSVPYHNHSTQIIPSLEDVSCPITELNERNIGCMMSLQLQILWLYDEVTHNFSGSLNGFKMHIIIKPTSV